MLFCGGCGMKLPEEVSGVVCPGCGTVNPEEAVFCGECGKNLKAPASEAPAAPVVPAAPIVAAAPAAPTVPAAPAAPVVPAAPAPAPVPAVPAGNPFEPARVQAPAPAKESVPVKAKKEKKKKKKKSVKALIIAIIFFLLAGCAVASIWLYNDGALDDTLEDWGWKESSKKSKKDRHKDDDDEDETEPYETEPYVTETAAPTATPTPTPTATPTPTPSPTPTPTPTPVPADPSYGMTDMSQFYEVAVPQDLTDAGSPFIIYGFNDEFPGLVDKYWGGSYTKVMTESNSYQAKLDQVLASGQDAPDLFVCDADYATKYMNSSDTIPVNELGISYSELSDMYTYTLQFAADDSGVIKGLAWQCCPAGVFYNRTVAYQTLGVSEPADVAPYFASWDAFMNTAQLVSDRSGGQKKIVSGTDDIWRAILNSRKTGWIVNGSVNIDPVMGQYFDMARTLHDNGLTFETTQWAAEWTANMSNQSVLSYWGPMWLLNFCMGFQDGSNPTTGDWGLVKAPGDYFWGGTWMMASKYCDNKASAGSVMRAIALDRSNLTDMTKTGEFVNSISIMTSLSTDPNYKVSYLAGQNPAAVLGTSAFLIDNSTVGPNDQEINDAFQSVVTSYLAGEIGSVSEAEAVFVQNVEALGIV